MIVVRADLSDPVPFSVGIDVLFEPGINLLAPYCCSHSYALCCPSQGDLCHPMLDILLLYPVKSDKL